MSETTPVIRPMSWVPARDVLPGEAADFTPWLADNLDLLAEALGLEELTLVDTEIVAAEKRIDILANATDDDGDEFPVIIENQYGITDHKHLGQVVTYLAQQGRGLAVWVVESAAEAHIAAVDFLNRTSSPDVGYVLTRVRFTHGGPGEFQVAFEMLAKPNTFLRQSRRRRQGADTAKINSDKKNFLAAILDQVKGPLERAGLRHIRMHTRGAYIEMRFPATNELDGRGAKLLIRSTTESCSVGLHVNGYDTREENAAALDILHDRYEHVLADTLPTHSVRDWHAGTETANSDHVRVSLDDHGYRSGDAHEAATWAQRACLAFAEAVTGDPVIGLDALVEERVARSEGTGTALNLRESRAWRGGPE